MPSKHLISLNEAHEMISKFRKMKEVILKDNFLNLDILPNCETFERSAFDTILAKEGCTSVRAYLGMDAFDQVRLIFVGVNENNEDLINSVNTADEDDDGDIFENGVRCPSVCPPPSPINP